MKNVYNNNNIYRERTNGKNKKNNKNFLFSFCNLNYEILNIPIFIYSK